MIGITALLWNFETHNNLRMLLSSITFSEYQISTMVVYLLLMIFSLGVGPC